MNDSGEHGTTKTTVARHLLYRSKTAVENNQGESKAVDTSETGYCVLCMELKECIVCQNGHALCAEDFQCEQLYFARMLARLYALIRIVMMRFQKQTCYAGVQLIQLRNTGKV